jgi:hypothetical protein
VIPDRAAPGGPLWRLLTRFDRHHPCHNQRNICMQTIAIVLIVLWALGFIGGYAMGGLLHILLVIAIVVLAVRFFTGRRVV